MAAAMQASSRPMQHDDAMASGNRRHELSKLSIFTAGAGIKPTDGSSIDLVFHQNDAVDEVRDSDLEEDPTGDGRDLGSAIGLVGYEPLNNNLAFEAIVGYFRPGDAFEDESDGAYFVGFETIFRF